MTFFFDANNTQHSEHTVQYFEYYQLLQEGKNGVFYNQIRFRPDNPRKCPSARCLSSVFNNTVESRYLAVDGTIFYKFKLPEVQINLHFG